MQTQSDPNGCGPAALLAALQAIGLHATQEAIGGLSGLTGRGTGTRGLQRAAKLLGATPSRWSLRDFGEAWCLLLGNLQVGRSAILSFDADDHWVAAVGSLGSRVTIIDPAAVLRPMVNVLSREALEGPWRGERGTYYGISFGKAEER